MDMWRLLQQTGERGAFIYATYTHRSVKTFQLALITDDKIYETDVYIQYFRSPHESGSVQEAARLVHYLKPGLYKLPLEKFIRITQEMEQLIDRRSYRKAELRKIIEKAKEVRG